MGLHLFWMFVVGLFAALAAEAESKSHFHRYMLSDYKPQLNRRTQLDYKRSFRRTQDQPNTKGGGSPGQMQRTVNIEGPQPDSKEISGSAGNAKEPVVLLSPSGKKVMIHELIVRIYQNGEYICVGTQVSKLVVVTAATCFDQRASNVVNVKTYANEVILGHKTNLNESYIQGEDSLLVTIALFHHPNDTKLENDIVKLCNHELQDQYVKVQVPIWIRSRHSIHSRTSWTLPVQECRHRIKDPLGMIATDNMICVRNQRYTRTCQNTIGTPLVNNNMICGVNVAGHNCPVFTGVNLYTTIYDTHEFAMSGLELLKKYNMDEAIL